MSESTTLSVSMAEYAAPSGFCRGIHHLALCTTDMKATIEFYTDVLGMPLVHAMRVPPGLGTGPKNRGNPPYENVRHYFFDMGNDSLIAFFELPKDAEPPHNRNAIGAMQHCSFVVAAARFAEIEAHLARSAIPYIGPLPQAPGLVGIYFYDPNGIRLEFSCQPEYGESPGVIDWATQRRAEAVPELRTMDGVTDAWLAQYAGALRD